MYPGTYPTVLATTVVLAVQAVQSAADEKLLVPFEVVPLKAAYARFPPRARMATVSHVVAAMNRLNGCFPILTIRSQRRLIRSSRLDWEHCRRGRTASSSS